MKLWLPVAVYMAVIFAFSSIPNPPTVSQSGSDKVLHLLLYGGLAALVVRLRIEQEHQVVDRGLVGHAALEASNAGASACRAPPSTGHGESRTGGGRARSCFAPRQMGDQRFEDDPR